MKKQKSKIIQFNVPIHAVTRVPGHHFFGYYDKCPWDASGRYLLALETDIVDRLPEKEDVARICLIDTKEGNRVSILGETRAWNFQQGAMLQWMGPDYSEHVIYNDRADGKFVAIVLNINTGEKRILPLPVYCVSPDGKRALSLSFSRLRHLRDSYGYAGVPDVWQEEVVPEEDGIWLLDIPTGETKLVISIRDLYQHRHISSMDCGKHWVDHIMFNTDGTRFCFLHRWELADGGMYNRLFTANPDGGELYCLLDSGFFSHFGWRNTKELLGWGRLPNMVNQVRKSKWFIAKVLRFILPVYHFFVPDRSSFRRAIINDHYLLLTDKTKNVRKIGEPVFTEDGHCSWSPDGRWFVTDTYPDSAENRTLILFNYEKGERIDIGSFYSFPDKKYYTEYNLPYPWNVSGMRCDLHPRWNRNGTEICIDSVHEGSRQIYTIPIRDIIRS